MTSPTPPSRTRSKAWCSSKSMFMTCRNISTRPNGWTASLGSTVASWAPSSACRSSAGGEIEPEMARDREAQDGPRVRRLIQNQPDPDFVLRPGFLAAIQLLPKYNLSFDICILHPQLPNTLDHDAPLSRRCPSSSITSASPGSRPASSTRGERTSREMAALPNVVCKLSGVTTEADHKSLDAAISSGPTSTT